MCTYNFFQSILKDISTNDTIESVIGKLEAETLSLEATLKEEPRDPVDFYLELLDSIVKFEDPSEKSTEPALTFSTPEETTEVGNIDYTEYSELGDYYFDEESLIPHNFDEDDLLLGDSFENEGNINLMTNDKSDYVSDGDDDDTLVDTNKDDEVNEEPFNAAFPELYRDLAIFNRIPKIKDSRKVDAEVRVKKRAEILPELEDIIDLKSTTTTTTTKATISTESVVIDEVNVESFEEVNFVQSKYADYPHFTNASEEDINDDLLVKTSSGFLYGHYKLSTKGTDKY